VVELIAQGAEKAGLGDQDEAVGAALLQVAFHVLGHFLGEKGGVFVRGRLLVAGGARIAVPGTAALGALATGAQVARVGLAFRVIELVDFLEGTHFVGEHPSVGGVTGDDIGSHGASFRQSLCS